MENIRREHKLQLSQSIRDQRNKIKWSEQTLSQLKNQTFSNQYVSKVQDDCKSKIEQSKSEISHLEEKLRELDAGLLDTELLSDHQQTQQHFHHKLELSQAKKQQKKIDSQEARKSSKHRFKSEIKEAWTHEHHRREMVREYHRYLKSLEFLPKYIRKNLSEMPNNKGYVWRGIYLYGDLPEIEGDPIALFEKLPKNVMLIHEWKGDTYRVYRKEGKTSKYLVFEEKRHNKRLNRKTLGDFLN